ncbi:MAG TPA: choice-of-anchor J domain-containing protein [Bacteroidales bacterium]|nr:choice-of-anchor J domain-containing protein [Bacteroidales bacterium]
MKRTIILLLAMLSLFALRVNAQWSITAVDTEFIIDFDNTVAGVNEGTFAGTGFALAPSEGQLNADTWAVSGMSDLAGLKDFGVEVTTLGDYARGASTGGVTDGGIYAFEVESGNVALGVQPSGADFTPGWIAFKITNNTGQTVNYDAFSYDVWVLNNANWSSSFNGEFSLDGINWNTSDGFQIATPQDLDPFPAWVKTTLSFEGFLGFDLADGQTVYFRIYSDDISGTNTRDEIAIDNISIKFSFKTIISTFPWIENFDGLTVPDLPLYWSVDDVDGVGSYWESSFSESHSVDNSMVHEYSSTVTQDGWLFTPALAIPSGNPYRLKFWSYNDYPGDYTKNSVLISTNGTNPSDFTEIWSPVSVDDSWGETKLDLSAYSGQTIFIAFRYEGYNGHDWYLDDVVVEEAPTETVDWCNLQWPDVGNVEVNVAYDVYARVFESGITEGAGEGADMECWIGYSTENTDPSTWTNWVPATYNTDADGMTPGDLANDEYMTSLLFTDPGTYYYASRFSYAEGPYSYGGYNTAGGNFWDGIDYVSGEVTVTIPLGGDCSNPIIVSLPAASPYTDLAQTNCGLGNFYEETCLDYYDSGEDIVYLLDVTELSYVNIEMTTAVTYTGIALMDNCPDVGTCLDYSTLSGAGTHTLEYSLPAGSYYLIIDTWAAPDCISSFDLTITAETDVCLAPVNLALSNFQSSQVTISWAAGFDETSWNLIYGAPGFDPDTEGTLVSDITSPYDLTGLTTNTDYEVYVQSNCVGGTFSDWSESIEFSTLCDPITTFPWTEDFLTVTAPALPDCWSENNVNGDGNFWQTYTTYGVGGSPTAGLYTDYNDGDNDDYLILPSFVLTGNEQLKFYVRARSTSEPNDYRVVLSTTGTNPADFTEELVPLTVVNWTTMTEITPINLSAYSGQTFIAIHVPSGGLDGYYIYFDNFTVEEIPACPIPTDLFVTDITNNSATLNWTENGSATTWNIKGSSTPIDPSVDPGEFNTSTSDNPYYLTGAPAGTTLYWYVQADCGGSYSEWSVQSEFTTDCDPISTFPWTEDFEAVTTPNLPDCWSENDNNADGDHWVTYTGYGVGNSKTAGLYTDYNDGDNDDYLILPAFDLTGNELLKFYVRARSDVEPNDYRVVLSTTGNSPADFIEELVPLTVVNWTTMTEVNSINLSAYTGPVYIAIHVPDGGLDGWYIYFDNFTVEEIPACPTPIDLFVTDITTNSATFNWTEFGSATSWNIKGSDTPIDPAVDPGTFFTNTNDNPYFATGLPSGTTLYWYVQADCGGDVSAWSVQGEFTTQCDPISTFPYFEGFEGANFAPNCWTNTTWEQSTWGTPHTGDNWAFTNLAGSELVSPAFEIPATGQYLLSYWYRAEDFDNPQDAEISLSVDGINFTTILQSLVGYTNDSYEKFTYDLSSYSGQNIWVKFLGQTGTGGWDFGFLVDDFEVRELSDENDILTFSFPQQTGDAAIDPILHTVNVEVAMGTDPNGLVPTFTISDFASVVPESGIAQDFTDPFIYTVTSESGIDQEWTVNVTVATTLSSANDILTFTLTQQTGPADIDNVEHTVDIEVTWNTDRSALTPVITISPLATIDPESETEQDFTNPFVYTVTAEDLTEQEWTVTVTNAPVPEGATCANAIDYGTINDPEVSGVMTDYSPVWYRFTITETYENVDIHTCGSNFDTKLAIFDDCGDVVNIPEYGQPTGSIGYNDDATGTYCSIDNNQSLVEFATLDPGTYYVVVYPYSLSTTPDLWALEIIGSLPMTPELNIIDLFSEVQDIEVCLETTEVDAIAELVYEITITNTDDEEFIVAVTWTIDSYDPITPGDYNATGTFELPAGVSQTDPATDLEVYAVVTVNALPVVTCPADFDVITIDPVTLNGATPVGGEYTGTGVSGGIFDPDGLPLGGYTITYTYTDPVTGCTNDCWFVINLDIPYPELTGIDIYSVVEDVEVCQGTNEADALALLVNQITIENAASEEFNVTVTWAILSYDENIAGDYNATGTFTLPAGISQTDPETTLEVYAVVTVNELPVVTCPADFEVTTEDIFNLTGANPEGGIYSGVGVTAGEFDPTGIENGDYTITYSYTDPLTGCSNFCGFVITLNIANPEIADIDIDDDVVDVEVCLGAEEADALALLTTQITITDSEDNEYVVSVNWTIDAFDGNTAGDYDATGSFNLPIGVSQTDPVTVLEVYAVVTVNELPVVECPDDFSVTTEDVVTLTGATPADGTYSGTGVTSGNFDPSALANGDYVITYTYSDPVTGCTNTCEFTITVDIDNNVITENAAAISVYPNPNNGLFNLNFSNVNGDVNYQIYDTKGSIIVDEKLFSNGNTILEISLDITPGVYYVKIITETQTMVEKLVIE